MSIFDIIRLHQAIYAQNKELPVHDGPASQKKTVFHSPHAAPPNSKSSALPL